jgi:hypothetical protein
VKPDTMICPHCNKPIPFRTIVFAVYPVWISCPSCRAKLVGDRFIKIQGFIVIPILAILLAVAVNFTGCPLLHQLELVVIGGFIVALPNVVATLKWGQYSLKTQKRHKDNLK